MQNRKREAGKLSEWPFGRKGRKKLSTGDLGEIKGKVVVVVVEREGAWTALREFEWL